MKNVKTETKDGKLIITIDLSQDHGLSKSGKTTLVATTGGNVAVANVDGQPVYLGLNCYHYADTRRPEGREARREAA